ncbi:alpha-L-fucosidase [Pedobacter psychroterrae]|uniref:alpha-L-fucosidase n=1 Tax=Pedobacter psychroterrae TaxID=2530453 RepID=A0A4R0NP54_9SPHI|nr:alpha-L-fucosidase [Pedobacter psychroterrae]TCD02752.1 alpha-L-fucosidase [Pedobacter psychroterrae]
MKSIIVSLFVLLTAVAVRAQENNLHAQSTIYEWPSDPLVRQKLDKWQDQKFGMIIHWGIYAVPGIIESWSICNEDWISRDSTVTYEDYKKWYWDLSKQFNPVNFDPEQWAQAGKAAGMRYLVFTTKHHDGFAMFDTKESDFSIAKGPFATNPRADVAKYVFDAFRKKGFMIGAYFSKPDWHSQYYWWSKYATADRNNNYDIRKNPWRWSMFKQYTFNQISELMHNYGSVDILWLDGGWVRPLSTVNDEVRAWGAAIPAWDQDIDMTKIADMGRKAQPGLLVVDRTVHGPYENYQTPEQRVPEHQLANPWESCMTLGGAWGFVPNDQYKSARQVIHTLAEVVAKGGSLLLGLGPQADGKMPVEVVRRMEEIGKWTSRNGQAIYNTRITRAYKDTNTWFTQSKDGKTVYAVYCIEGNQVPKSITLHANLPGKGSTIKLLETGKTLKWKNVDNAVEILLPQNLPSSLPALALAIQTKK